MSDDPAQWQISPACPVLAAGEIHVFAFALDPPAPLLVELERQLSGGEMERARRFRQARDRRRYSVGRAQMRTILGRLVGRNPRELDFRYGPQGKPALCGGAGLERVRFSVSRSHERGVLAVQLDEDLGVDLERIRPFPSALDIAKRLFAAEEHEALRALSADELDAGFFSYWTRKEALVKSVGLGISHPMDTFVLAPHPCGIVERVVLAGPEGVADRWSLPVPPPASGYVAALATAGGARPLRCWAWDDPPAPE